MTTHTTRGITTIGGAWLFQLLAVVVTVVTLIVGSAHTASAIDWTGGGNGTNWADGANWAGGVSPGAADEARFTTGALNVVNVPAAVGNIRVIGVVVNLTGLAAGNTLTLGTNGIEVGNGGSLTFGNFTVVGGFDGFNDMFIHDNSSLQLNGPYEIVANGWVQCYTESTCAISIKGLRLFGQFFFECDTAEAAYTRLPVTIDGNVLFLGNGAGIDAFELMDATWLNFKFIDLTLKGNLDASAIGQLDQIALGLIFADVKVPVGGNCVLSGPTDTFNSFQFGGRNFLGNLLISGTLRYTAGVNSGYRSIIWNIRNSGTLNFADSPLGLGGTLELADGFIENTNLFSTTGNVLAPDLFLTNGAVANLQRQMFIGNVPFGGAVAFSTFQWLVKHGATATFNGGAAMGDSAFDNETLPVLGCEEDGITATGRSTINIAVTLGSTATRAGCYSLGEGTHTLTGGINLTSTDNQVRRPNALNDEPVVINMNGSGTLNANFSAGGSYWQVDNVGAGARFTQAGMMTLIGNFHTATATAGTAWNANAAGVSIRIGDGTFPVTSTVTSGPANVLIASLTVPEVNNGIPADRTVVTITRSPAGAAGSINISNMTVAGDTINNGGGADQNNAVVTFDNARARLGNGTGGQGAGTGLRIGNGTTANQGFGGVVNIQNGSIITIPNDASLIIGQGGSATEVNAGARLITNGVSQTMGSATSITANANTTMTLGGVTTTATGAWSITTTNAFVSYIDSLIRTTQAAGLSVSSTGGTFSSINTRFERMNATGLSITGANVTSFNQNVFASGVTGGAHLTLSGLTNARLNADSNEFDDTVDTSNAGLLVNVAAAPARLTFRHASDDHGLGGFNITSVGAENNGDNDGTTATDVLWSSATLLTASKPSTQPGAFQTDSADHAVLAFELTADASGASTVSAITFTFSGTPSVVGRTLKLWLDSGTVLRDLDGSDVQQGANTVAGSTTVTIGGLSIGVPANGTVNMLLSVNFGGAQTNGTLTTGINPGGITEVAGNIINGLPISHTISNITGPAASLVIIVQPANGGPAAPFATQPVIELRDASGIRVWSDSSSSVTVSIETGPGGAVLTTVLSVQAVQGRSSFDGLTLDVNGTYTLRFTLGGAFVISNNLIVAPGGGGSAGKVRIGFGCAGSPDAASSSRLLGLMLALLTLLGIVRVRGWLHS
ncbi:MAG: beta strand repeat-containing protein [Planctomycetota bacterium]